MIGHSEFPAASYDEWKTRSPYDGPLYEPEPDECEHMEVEIDWDGTRHCLSCGDARMATPAEVAAWDRLQRKIERDYHRERSPLWRAWRWLLARFERRPKQQPIDDEIPF